MIFCLVLAALSFVGLMVYATIAVATARIFYANRIAGCRACSHPRDYYCSADHEVTAGLFGIFWVVSIFGIGLGYAIGFLAKGPIRWGNALADLPRRRELRQERRENDRRALQARIQELEAELIAEGVLTSV